MSLEDLRPANSKKARDSSVNAFMRFLAEESVSTSLVDKSVQADSSGGTLIALMDRFGVYLAQQVGKDGKPLARNTVGQYFRQTKLWLYTRYPQYAQLVDSAILAKGRTLERFSGMRSGGRTVKQAIACRKQDLHLLMSYLYTSATVGLDYQDAALLSLLWYLFGRASDLAMLEKQSLSLCSENIFFVRFLRMKTSDEQGLTIYPDESLVTCPITALAAALVLQTAPSPVLLPHLPQPVETDLAIHGPLVPLSAVLTGATNGRSLLEEAAADDQHEAGEEMTIAREKSTKAEKSSKVPLGIHAYVNRVPSRISSRHPTLVNLSSHSFRRGGAQHVNGKAGISPHWIADRGGWNMSTTNKLFTYIFNTTEEDQKVAKILSSRDANASVKPLDISHFDAATRTKVDLLKDHLYSTCMGLTVPKLNVSTQVIDVLCAYLIKAYPRFRSLNVDSPLVKRVNVALEETGVAFEELMSWSVHLQKVSAATSTESKVPSAKHLEMIEHQSAVIDQLIDLSRGLSDRLHDLEREMGRNKGSNKPGVPKKRQLEITTNEPTMKRRKRQSTHLWESWYEWVACRSFKSEGDKQWKSTVRKVVGYMLLFAESLEFDDGASDFRDAVLAVGKQLDAKVHAFLADRGVSGSSTGTIEKKLRALHKTGALNQPILDFQARVRAGLVVVPTSLFERAALDLIVENK